MPDENPTSAETVSITASFQMEILQLKVAPLYSPGDLVDVVMAVQIRITGLEGDVEKQLVDWCQLPSPQPQLFLPYGDLDEPTVVSWLPQAWIDGHHQDLQRRINMKIAQDLAESQVEIRTPNF